MRAFTYGSQVSYKYQISQPSVEPFFVERKRRSGKVVWQAGKRRKSQEPWQFICMQDNMLIIPKINTLSKSTFPSVILPLKYITLY